MMMNLNFDLLQDACENELEMLMRRERTNSYEYRTATEVLTKLRGGKVALTPGDHQILYQCAMNSVSVLTDEFVQTYSPPEREAILGDVEDFATLAGQLWYHDINGIFRYDAQLMKDACKHEVWRSRVLLSNPTRFVKAFQVLCDYDKTAKTKTLVEPNFRRWTAAALEAVKNDMAVWKCSALVSRDEMIQRDFVGEFAELCRLYGGVCWVRDGGVEMREAV